MSPAAPRSRSRSLTLSLSPKCQQTVVGLFNSSGEAYQCLHVDSLIPALLTNGSLIGPVDDYLSAVCYSDACSSSTFNQTINSVLSGCSTELNAYGVSNSTVLQYVTYDNYLLARDIACLKTEDPMSLPNATIAANDTSYNTTNGTFCVTDLATDLSAYLGVNLTNSYVDTAVLGGNYSALQALEAIPPQALCTDCIFAAVELINEGFPAFGNITVNRTTNATIDSYLNATCAGTPYNVTNDGELPDSIVEAATNATSNSTSASNATSAVLPTMTMNATSAVLPTGTASILSVISSEAPALTGLPVPSASAPARRAMAEKKRWFGL